MQLLFAILIPLLSALITAALMFRTQSQADSAIGVGMAVSFMLAALADRAAATFDLRRRPMAWPGRWVISILIACWIGLSFSLTPEVAFQKVFSLPVPTGASQVQVKGYYAIVPGGAGDHTIFLKFSADRKTLDALLKGRGFTRDMHAEAEWKCNLECDDTDFEGHPLVFDREPTWFHNFPKSSIEGFGHSSWLIVPLIPEVEIFHFESPTDIEYVNILYDPANKVAYALYLWG